MTPEGSLPRDRRLPVAAAALLLLVAAAYQPTVANDFVNYDDPLYVTGNDVVQRGVTVEGIGWALTTTEASNWHPVTWLSHMLDVELFGMDPGWHHAVSVVLHATNAVLVLLLFQGMVGSLWRAFLVAGLFAVHPIHVESVAWIAERKDVLSLLFGLSAMLAYVHFVRGRRRRAYGLMLVFFALSLMSKPMLVTLPFLLLLLDYWPLRRLGDAGDEARPGGFDARVLWVRIKEKVPLLAMTVASIVITLLAQGRGGALRDLQEVSLGDRLSNAIVSVARYMGKTVWPTDLSVHYPLESWPLRVVVPTGLALLCLTAVFVWLARRRPPLLVGWLWFLGTLVPVIGIVQVGTQAMADRYTYLPGIGLLVILAWSLPEPVMESRRLRRAAVAMACVVLLLLTGLTRRQTRFWRDGVHLFEHAVEVTPRSPFAHYNLGMAHLRQGTLDPAIRQFREAVRLDPAHFGARNNLALALTEKGRTDEANEQYRALARIHPSEPIALNNLGLDLERRGETEEAARAYRGAIGLDPDFSAAHMNLSSLYRAAGDTGAALRHSRRAVALSPESAGTHDHLARMLYGLGRIDEALRHSRRAAELAPRDVDVRLGLGVILLARGAADEAIPHLELAVRERPDDAYPHNQLGIALARLGRIREALPHFQRAVTLDPTSDDARQNLLRAREMLGESSRP